MNRGSCSCLFPAQHRPHKQARRLAYRICAIAQISNYHRAGIRGQYTSFLVLTVWPRRLAICRMLFTPRSSAEVSSFFKHPAHNPLYPEILSDDDRAVFRIVRFWFQNKIAGSFDQFFDRRLAVHESAHDFSRIGFFLLQTRTRSPSSIVWPSTFARFMKSPRTRRRRSLGWLRDALVNCAVEIACPIR